MYWLIPYYAWDTPLSRTWDWVKGCTRINLAPDYAVDDATTEPMSYEDAERVCSGVGPLHRPPRASDLVELEKGKRGGKL